MGYSEGRRGIYEDTMTCLEDQIEFCHAYDPQATDVPRFMVTNSLGSLLGLSIQAEVPDLFKGASHIVPCIDAHKKMKDLMARYKTPATLLNYIMPTYKFTVKGAHTPRHL